MVTAAVERQIRRAYERGVSSTELARQHGVSRTTIWRIVNR
jgi:transposase-like protein